MGQNESAEERGHTEVGLDDGPHRHEHDAFLNERGEMLNTQGVTTGHLRPRE